MRKFQQGGVSVYNVPQGIVQPNIPNSPVINAPLIPVVDMSPYLNAQMDQQRRKEVYDRELLRQQQSQLASDQKAYFSIYDDVFGTVHNKGQQEVIDAAKKKYGVDMEALLSAKTQAEAEAQMKAIRRAADDPDVKRVMGEVTYVDKALGRPLPQLEEDELGGFNDFLSGYFSNTDPKASFPLKQFDGNYWNRPKPIPNTSFLTAASGALKNFGTGTDFNDPNELARYENNWASNMALQNETAALKQGFIFYPEGSTVARPTEKGQAIAREQLGQFLTTDEVKSQRRMDEFEQKRIFNNNNPSPNSGGSGSPAQTEKEKSAVQKNWHIILSQPAYDAKYGAMDPFAPGMEWLYDYILSRTRMSDGTFTGTNDMRTVGRELDDIIKNVYTPKFNPAPAATDPNALPKAPPRGTTTTPPTTGKPKGSWEFGPDGKRRQVQ